MFPQINGKSTPSGFMSPKPQSSQSFRRKALSPSNLNRLSSPKYKELTVDDLENDKLQLKDMLDEIKDEIKDQVKGIFESKDQETITELENLQVNNNDIIMLTSSLTNKKETVNSISFKVK